jgi:hypothetical protein
MKLFNMEMLCVSTFGLFGRIKGLSFNRVYKVKFFNKDKLLIINDFGKPQMVQSNNFVNYQNIKKLDIQYFDFE